MFVIKRSGKRDPMRYDNITDRNIELSNGLDIDVAYLSKIIIQSLKNGMTTNEIDELSSETAAYMSSYEPDYDVLAARISVSNHTKLTFDSFYETMNHLFLHINKNTNKRSNIINDVFMQFVNKNRKVLDEAIDYSRDFNYSYFGFKTLQKLYLLKIDKRIVERPQHMLMRVACTIHGPSQHFPEGDIDRVIETYNQMSNGFFTHASPTLFNAGAAKQQLSSCFLLKMEDDLKHIYETSSRCALISKHGGGIGIDISNVRAKGSIIHSNNGVSDGIVPMIQVFNATARYCNQCFTGDTKIHTLNGLERIDSIKVGNVVVTHTNLLEYVTHTHKRYIEEQIIGIKTAHSKELLRMTKDHQIMVCEDFKETIKIDMYKDSNDMIYKNDVILTYKWKSAGELTLDDCLVDVSSQEINSYECVENQTMILKDYKQYTEMCNPITYIDRFFYRGDVYDLTVNKNHTYHTLHGVVHNSGKRKGSIAMYLQPWHPDVVDFLLLRNNNPPEELRARDIFLALWVNDLFMKRVEKNEIWSLFCPNDVPELHETFGDEFEKVYLQAEKSKRYIKQMKARDLWEKILQAQTETGLPYILYKDSINRKNMQSNIDIIRSSNLCAEIVEVTGKDSVSVCNLASIALPKFVDTTTSTTPMFNYEGLYKITKLIVRNIDNIIDINYYPIEEAKSNNLSYRPMGIGIQGLADVFAMFKTYWGSQVATTLNKEIFETIYYAAVEASHELSLEKGSYDAFEGSPYSKGVLQYHLWNVSPTTKYDWKGLEQKVKLGMRNSLLVALMPTASSSQILNNNECFEAFTSNLYSRNTLAGDFIMLNKHLVKDLKKLGLWNRQLVNKIIENDGSVQLIDELSQDIKNVYKTVWEIPQKIIIDYAADRAPFIDQTQSMNIFIDHPTIAKLSSMHMYGWKKGLKTGSYYIRSKPARNAVKFSILPTIETVPEKVEVVEGKEYVKNGVKYICTDDICINCGS